ncbi:MAG: dihydroxyacetone kinase subunit DhaL [Sphaerochaetaceae bacterium]|nr:dihydroxyacetone kinase subunit DhaL [Sphaerochaetaceae bacterium]
MNKIDVNGMSRIIKIMGEVIIEKEILFCELDSKAGDGDFGMSIAKGFKVLLKKWEYLNRTDIGALLKDCGMIIMENCGGASGPIWGTAFRSSGNFVKGKTIINLFEFAEMVQAGVDGIKKIGGAELGDKTLLDALIPTALSLKKSSIEKKSFEEAFKIGALAAVNGADKTKEYSAKKGRASYLGERSLSYPDAGAMALGIIFTEIANKF